MTGVNGGRKQWRAQVFVILRNEERHRDMAGSRYIRVICIPIRTDGLGNSGLKPGIVFAPGILIVISPVRLSSYARQPAIRFQEVSVNTTEHRFVTLDEPESCAQCGKQTTVMFTGRLCSRCVGVWSPEQRRAIQHTLQHPYQKVEKKRRGKSREDMFKAAPGGKAEGINKKSI
jgi:hypothetical protein